MLRGKNREGEQELLVLEEMGTDKDQYRACQGWEHGNEGGTG